MDASIDAQFRGKYQRRPQSLVGALLLAGNAVVNQRHCDAAMFCPTQQQALLAPGPTNSRASKLDIYDDVRLGLRIEGGLVGKKSALHDFTA